MVELNRVRVGLSGFTGGPGVCTFYFLGLQTARQSLQTLFTSLATLMPNDVTISVEATGDIIESTTGDLVGAWSKDALPLIVGSDVGVYAAPAGFMLRWETGQIVASRRVRGRTFIVPAGAGAYQDNGSLLPLTVTNVQGLLQAFIFEQSLDFVIWSRPFIGAAAVPAGPTTPARAARPARLGSAHRVTVGTVPDKVAVLRSRRD